MAGNENNIVTKMTVDAKAAITNVEELNQALGKTLKNLEAAMAALPSATKEFERLNLARVKVEESIKTLKRVDEEGKVVGRSRKIGTATVEYSPQEKAAVAKEKADTEKTVRERKKLSAEEVAANEASLREKRRQRAEERQIEAASKPLTYPQMTRARRLSERLKTEAGPLSELALPELTAAKTRGALPEAIFKAEELLDVTKQEAAAKAAIVKERLSKSQFRTQAKKKILALEEIGTEGAAGYIATLERAMEGQLPTTGAVRGQLISGTQEYLDERKAEAKLSKKRADLRKFLLSDEGAALSRQHPELYEQLHGTYSEAASIEVGEKEKPQSRRALAETLAKSETQYALAKQFATEALKQETEAKKKSKKKDEEGDKVKTEANKTEADATKRKKHRMTVDEIEARRKEREAHPDVIARKEAAKAKKEADDAAKKKLDDAKFEARQAIKEGRFGTLTSALGTIGAVRAIGGGAKQLMETLITGDPLAPVTGGLSFIGGIGQGVSRYFTAKMLTERTLGAIRATRAAELAAANAAKGTPTGGTAAGEAASSAAGGAAAGGMTGAVAGSFFPGLGNVTGFLIGSAVGGMASLTSSAVKAGDEVVKLANARSQAYDLALGSLYQASPLGGIDQGERAKMAFAYKGSAKEQAEFSQYIKAYAGNEQRYRMKREQMARVLAQPGLGMTLDEQTAAIASMTSAAGINIPGTLGATPFEFRTGGGFRGSDVTAALGLGRLTNTSPETIGKYIGAFGRKTFSKGPVDQEQIVYSLSALIGAANRTGLIGTGADAFVNEFIGIADAANKRGISFDVAPEIRFIQRLAAGGMTGAGIGKLTAGYNEVTGGLLGQLTQGTDVVLQGLLAAQVGMEPDIKTEADVIRRLQKMTTEEKLSFVEKNVPELLPRAYAYFGMTEEEGRAAAARPKRLTEEEQVAQAPMTVEPGALALGTAEAQLQVKQMLYTEYSTQIIAMKGFTSAVQDITTSIRGWMVEFLR